MFITLALLVFNGLFAVMACPEKKSGILPVRDLPSEVFSKYHNEKNTNVPDSILIILVDFPDVKFKDKNTAFEGYDHNLQYFKKYMQHLSEYYYDASHGKYNLQSSYYTFYPDTVTTEHNMGYYGNDEKWSQRIAEFFKEVIEKIDDDIDFNNFDSIIIFHAGAGQETDITGNNSDDLWTTFITRRTLQQGFDPENDSYQGILTNDGKYVKEAVVMPESEQQPDYSEGDTKYGLLGVLAHEFGHLLGLPTLFDNYSENGRSAGIGNFGVMGTGVWNANGFVPPLPCAWSRYYLGWEDGNIVEISNDSQNNSIAYPMMNTMTPKLYKVNISDKEYFLLENRQQNPDNSTIHGFPNFTFPLLPDSLQDYYPPPNDDVPMFNFMENSYAGCEWDFFLPGPGYGEPPGADNKTINGSGLFIWHIDEYVIDMLFDPDFEYNYVNYDSSHKGVDLEEASGYQYLDSIGQTMDSFGTPFASFREGNNTYFGYEKNPETGYLSFPTAQSYYGGINLEIYDISASNNTMTFSVRFAWNLNPNYNGITSYPPLITDIQSSHPGNEIISVMDDGHIFFWRDKDDMDMSLSLTLTPIVKLYAYDEFSEIMILPTEVNQRASYYTFSGDISDFRQYFLDEGYEWASHPVVNKDIASASRAFLPLNSKTQNASELVILNNSLFVSNVIRLDEYKISSNLMIKQDKLYFIASYDNKKYLAVLDVQNQGEGLNYVLLSELQNRGVRASVLADLDYNGINDIAITTNDSLLYLYTENGELFDNFPVKMELNAFSVPSIADVNGNGELDILVGGENSFLIVNKTGKTSRPYLETSFPDSLKRASGVIACDINNDGKTEVIGNFSKNRLAIWSNKNGNDFVLDIPTISYREFSRFAPTIAVEKIDYQTNVTYVYVATDNGLIFRKELPLANISQDSFWFTEYSNYQRTAAYDYGKPQNNFSDKKVFVDNETYLYPNPLNKINSAGIFGGNGKENQICVRFMITSDDMVEMKYFNINGDLIGSQRKKAYKYSADVFYIDAKHLSSGIYLCTLKSKGKIKKFKFAVEK